VRGVDSVLVKPASVCVRQLEQQRQSGGRVGCGRLATAKRRHRYAVGCLRALLVISRAGSRELNASDRLLLSIVFFEQSLCGFWTQLLGVVGSGRHRCRCSAQWVTGPGGSHCRRQGWLAWLLAWNQAAGIVTLRWRWPGLAAAMVAVPSFSNRRRLLAISRAEKLRTRSGFHLAHR